MEEGKAEARNYNISIGKVNELGIDRFVTLLEVLSDCMDTGEMTARNSICSLSFIIHHTRSYRVHCK